MEARRTKACDLRRHFTSQLQSPVHVLPTRSWSCKNKPVPGQLATSRPRCGPKTEHKTLLNKVSSSIQRLRRRTWSLRGEAPREPESDFLTTAGTRRPDVGMGCVMTPSLGQWSQKACQLTTPTACALHVPQVPEASRTERLASGRRTGEKGFISTATRCLEKRKV